MSQEFWQDFFTRVIETYRHQIDGLPESMKTELDTRFLEPCQIEVMEFGINRVTVVATTNNKSRPDMEIIVHEKPENPDDFLNQFIKRNPELEYAREGIKGALFEKDPRGIPGYYLCSPHYRERGIFDLKGFSPQSFANEQFSSTYDQLQRDIEQEEYQSIKDSSQAMKSDIEGIPESRAKSRIENRLGSIEESIQKIGEMSKRVASVEGDIKGIRTVMGTSIDVKDWRLIMPDIETLKKEHVPKEVFEAKVNELNTRINSLSEMKTEYDKLLAQQNEFMKQQAEVMKQQSSFVTWIKYSTILVPVAVVSAPIIYALLRHFLGIP